MKITTKKVKTLTLAATLIATSFSATSAFAWGPERDTFTMEHPASYPTFNSITDNPTIGDERDFVRVGQINADVTELGDEVEVVPGKQYLVYIYFHNNASATYNDSAHDNKGVAVNTRMSSSFSKILTPEQKATITATITANNSDPASVWDEAYMTTTYGKVLLHYVAGSAKIWNDWQANGSIMPSSLFTEEGTLLGLNELNGVIPGCEEYHGVVSYVLQADELEGTVDKQVSKDGTNYADSIDAVPGEELTFRLTIKNAGDIALTNATIADALPSGLELVSGSVQLSANDSGVWETQSDNLIGTGFNLGTVGTGNTIYITYRAKVVDNIDCGSLNFANTATLTYDSETSTGDSDTDSTTINVKKDGCEPTPTPETPKEIVKTGPLEITMAVIVILGITAGGFYLYRTRRTLKTVEDAVTGSTDNSSAAITKEEGINPAETPAAETPATEAPAPSEPGTAAPASFSEPAEPAKPAEPAETEPAPEQNPEETPSEPTQEG